MKRLKSIGLIGPFALSLNPNPYKIFGKTYVKVSRSGSNPFYCLIIIHKVMENFYLGVDVSKRKIDLCLRSNSTDLIIDVLPNDVTAISQWIKRQLNNFNIALSQLVICAEYTGKYTYQLVQSSKILNVCLCLEDPTRIKYSNGCPRGKNDKVDAHRIAVYAERYHDCLKIYQTAQYDIKKLRRLYSDRSMIVTDRAKYRTQLKDDKDYMDENIYDEKYKLFIQIISVLDSSIKALEEEMQKIVLQSPKIYNQVKLLKSITGVGDMLAFKMIIETEAFSLFDNNPRRFCCYAGVAPFSYTSGSSQKSKTRVSHRANKSIKFMLHLAALSATRMKETPLSIYYQRKVEEGKNKMSVLNAIRAKLVFIMFAVVKNDKPYSILYINILEKP
jgi:transposase